MKTFWKGVKSMRDNDVLVADKVGGAVGDANISKLGPLLRAKQS